MNKVEVGKIEKMSKSKKNVVNPSSIIDMYGADTARWFMLSDSPPERDLEWTDVGVASSYKFINKIWDTCTKAKTIKTDGGSSKISVFNKLINSISENIEKFHFNKSVANIYEYVNELNKLMDQKNISEEEIKVALDNLCIVLQPFTPHLSEEIWEMLGNDGFCANTSWPELTNDNIDENYELPIQVNGKLKGLVSVKKEEGEESLIKRAKSLSAVEKALKQKTFVKTIYIPKKILNIVVK